MKEEEIYFMDKRTEEIQHIIERMPRRFGFWVSVIVAFLFILMLVFGWFIRYPDIVIGQIVVNANVGPLKLIANSNGKLKLRGIRSMNDIKENQIIAYVENTTKLSSVVFIDSLLRLYNPSSSEVNIIKQKLPHNFSLGELNTKYYAFVNNLQNFINYKYDGLYEKQEQNLKGLLIEQKQSISSALKRIDMAEHALSFVRKFYSRDSSLFVKNVISESELDKTQMSYLSNKDALQNAINNLIIAKQGAQQTEGKLQELDVQKPEKEKELYIALISSYNDLMDNIKNWEQKYVFRSPFNGKVQFLKFYTENQFVQAGEQVFTLVPKEENIFGQVILPAQGSGKVKIGQEVIVKLDNYPYMEYGSITGRVRSISLTTTTTKAEKNDIETYMVLVAFPKQLKTNYNAQLDFRAEAKGTAEIITNDRRLIHRLFDNLKYVMIK